MRRVSYHFPRTCDYRFSISVPFQLCLSRIASLADRQDNFRDNRGAVKREFSLAIACNRLDFERLTPAVLSQVTDEADLSLIISDTVLRAEGKRPDPAQTFLVKLVDAGSETEIFVAHISEPQAISWRDVMEYIRQAVA